MASSFERLVTRAMREPTDPGTPCPSAETLAAYLEGALGASEHASVELHASRCARCAAHLAALVQLEDQLSAGAPPARPWWRRPWLVPVGAAIVAGVVWSSLPRERVAELTRPGISETPRVGGAATPPNAGPSPAAAPPSPGDRASEPRTTENTNEKQKADAPDARAAESRSAGPGAANVVASPEQAPPAARQEPPSRQKAASERDARGQGSPAGRELADTLSSAGPPAPVASEALAKKSEVSEDKSVRQDARLQTAEEVPRARGEAAGAAQGALPGAPVGAADSTFAAQTARPAAKAAAPAPAAPGAAAFREANEPGIAAVTSATDPAVAWRVVGGRIERTTDGGKLWAVEPGHGLTAPVAASAPSRDVCWMAGAGNVLVRRGLDGQWTRVPVPAADFIVAAIDARSALEATLIATDGRRSATTDGGKSWTGGRP